MFFAYINYEVLMSVLTEILFRRQKADNYPGKGLFNKPEPLRKAIFNRELCRGCGDCESICYYRRIRVDKKGRAHIRRGCSGCAMCRDICPSGAIIMIEND